MILEIVLLIEVYPFNYYKPLILVQIPFPTVTSSYLHSKPSMHVPKQFVVVMSHPQGCPSSNFGLEFWGSRIDATTLILKFTLQDLL